LIARPVCRTLLCIDDQPDELEVQRAELEEVGYRVLTARSGQSAFPQLKSYPVDGIILDYRIPGEDGEELATQIWRAHPKLPILLLSAYTFLVPDRLLHAVDAFIDKARPMRERIVTIQKLFGAAQGLTVATGEQSEC
jgi:CheY-like chemotaxis protein